MTRTEFDKVLQKTVDELATEAQLYRLRGLVVSDLARDQLWMIVECGAMTVDEVLDMLRSQSREGFKQAPESARIKPS